MNKEEQDKIVQRRHRCILELASRYPEKAGGSGRHRVLIRNESSGLNMTTDDMLIVRFEDEFETFFSTGRYLDQGFFKDLIKQAKKEIKR